MNEAGRKFPDRCSRVFRLFSFLRAIIVSISLSGFLVVSLISPRTGSTHEPITTKVMFNREVIRILQRNCLGCHSPGKIKADVSLTNYEEARPWAKAIKEEVLEKRMMPYQAVKGFGSFQHDYALPQRDIDLLVSWVEGGAPKGEEKDFPKQAIEQLIAGDNWSNGRPDLILQPPTETRITAEDDGKVRCFAFPTGLKEDRWIKEIDFQPGNGTVVYRASFFLMRSSPTQMAKSSNRSGAACQLNGDEAGLENLGQWVPGQAVNRLPQGVARLMPANSWVLIKVRYQKPSEEAADRSRIGIYFTKDQVNRTVRNLTINAPKTRVPADVERHRIVASYTFPEATEALAIRPLLFPLAKSIEAVAHRPDGTTEVLIWVKNYRFDWQPAYYFKNPVILPKDTRIDVTAYLDSAENNGQNSHDESESGSVSDTICEITLSKTVVVGRLKAER